MQSTRSSHDTVPVDARSRTAPSNAGARPPAAGASRAGIVTGRVLTTLAVVFLLVDGIARAVHFQPYLDGTLRAGFDAGLSIPIGILLVVCTVLYALPVTTVLGAILLTAYLGGATATNLRIGDPIIFPVIFGVWVWAGVYLRDSRLAALVPRRRGIGTD